MTDQFPIRNKVAESGIITIDLEELLPKDEIIIFDIKDYLFREMILKEKDFREALKNLEWEKYRDKNVGIVCTADAIVPLWAYMLITSYLQPLAAFVGTGDDLEIKKRLLLKNINEINTAELEDARIVVKGCGDQQVGEYAYAEITKVLLPVVKSIMYGEPCSTVPVYKKKIQKT